MNIPTPYRSPPTLRSLLLDGGGEFNHLIWQVRPTLDADKPVDSLATIHEWAHHELNNVSSFGLLLTYFAFLARHADRDRERFHECLSQLVDRCHTAHEVYATWYSVELLTVKYPLETLLGELPAEYRTFHQFGEKITRTIKSPFLRQQAFLVALRSCFEALPFSDYDCRQTDASWLEHICDKDMPNARLEFVCENMPEGVFTEWTATYIHTHADTVDGAAIRAALDRARQQSFFDLALADEEVVLARYLAWVSGKWNEWLALHDLRNGGYESHLELVSPLVEDINRLCVTSTHPLRPSLSPHDTAAILLQQMESEVVQLRSEPISVDLIPIGVLPRDIWTRIPVGEPAHLLVQARLIADVYRQHAVKQSEILDVESDSEPLVFVRRRAGQTETGGEKANILYFKDPEELAELRGITADVPAYGLISSSLTADQAWRDQWLHPSVLWVTKIDHSLHSFLSKHCQDYEEIHYSAAALRDGARTLHFLCFLTRQAGETHWGLFIAFGSQHTVQACVQFIQHKMDSKRFLFDREPFSGDLAPALRVIVTHMMADEHFFSFNQLVYS